jgi:hypothetical protein
MKRATPLMVLLLAACSAAPVTVTSNAPTQTVPPALALAGSTTPTDDGAQSVATADPCFESGDVRKFSADSDQTLEVLTGDDVAYEVTLRDSCPAARTASAIGFTAADGQKVCGVPGDLLMAGSEVCEVERVSPKTDRF